MQWDWTEKQLNSRGQFSQDFSTLHEIQKDLETKNIKPENFKEWDHRHSEREVLRRLVGRAGYSVSGQSGRTERPDLHSVQGHTWVPSSENVAEAMAEAGRLYHDSAGAIKNKPEAERADAQEQLGLPFVYVWVAFLRSLASTKELGAEHVAALRQYWENSVLKRRTSAVGIARSVLQSEAVQESRGQGRGGRGIVFCWTRSPSPSRERWRQHCGCRKG